jgi:hypothetical protein
MMSFDKDEAFAWFEHFMSIMEEQLNWLISMAESHGYVFAYSPKEFEDIECLFDEMKDRISDNEINRLSVVFGRYLGEIVRRNYGGEWLMVTDKNDGYFNQPVIVGHTRIDGIEFAPIFLMRAYAKKRERGMLRIAVDADINPVPLDLSHFPTEDGKM